MILVDTKRANIIFHAILSVCIIVPLSNDIFISSFPVMSQYFTGCNISLMLSVFFLGLAIAQPIYGPLSDRFGRRIVLIGGLWIYTIASAITMLTQSFPILITGRFFQALGVCSASVSVYAIVRDVCDQKSMISSISTITAIISIGPTLAPLLGSLLNMINGWRTSFIFLFAIGCGYIIIVQLLFVETLHEKNPSTLTLKNVSKNYWQLVRRPNFFIFCIVRGFVYGIFFSFFSLSTLFIIQQMHFSTLSYSLLMALNGLVMFLSAKASPLIARKVALFKIMFFGLFLIMIGGVLMLFINRYIATNIFTLLLPMSLVTMGIGVIMSTASTGALQLTEKNTAGSATAVINTISFVFASLVTGIVPKLIGNVEAFALLIFILGALPLLIMKNLHGISLRLFNQAFTNKH